MRTAKKLQARTRTLADVAGQQAADLVRSREEIERLEGLLRLSGGQRERALVRALEAAASFRNEQEDDLRRSRERNVQLSATVQKQADDLQEAIHRAARAKEKCEEWKRAAEDTARSRRELVLAASGELSSVRDWMRKAMAAADRLQELPDCPSVLCSGVLSADPGRHNDGCALIAWVRNGK